MVITEGILFSVESALNLIKLRKLKMTNANFVTLNRRANAEGINLQAIKNILVRIHNETEHGVSHDVVDDAFVIDYYGIPEYRGGYIYGGWSVIRNDIIPAADIVETRWSKSPTAEPTTPFGEWAAAVKAAPIGAVLELKCSLEFVSEYLLTKVAPNEWERTKYCGEFAQREEDMGVTLYEGIRQQVADELGVDTSNTFHQCFDRAVESLRNY